MSNYQRKTRCLLLAVLLLISVVTTACAGRLTPDQTEELAGGIARFALRYIPAVNLPRVVLTYDTNGVPSIFGIKTATITAFLGVDLSFLNLSPELIEQFAAANIQHLEIETAREGFFVYINGKSLPYLAWDEATLGRLGDLVVTLTEQMLGEQAPTDITNQMPILLGKILPILSRVGVDLVLQFPMPAGAEAIPLRDRSVRQLAMPAEVESPIAINLTIPYTADGTPTILGLSPQDLFALTGMDLSGLALSPETIARLQALDIQEIKINTESDGLYLALNGELVLHLAYSPDHLANALELYRVFGGDPALIDTLTNLVPILAATDINLTLKIPAG